MKVNIIGSGKVAGHLAKRLAMNDFVIETVYSRTMAKAKLLADQLGATFTDDLESLIPDVDVNIIAVADDAIAKIAKHLPESCMTVHTSGSIGIEALTGIENRGVLYPLQTFSESRVPEISEVPFLIEANNDYSLSRIQHIVKDGLKANFYEVSSSDRSIIHLAAVFACNFTTKMMAYAEEVLKDTDYKLDLLKPLVFETIEKIFETGAENALTGPALRGDKNVINFHLKLLKDIEKEQVYKLISTGINPTIL